MIIVADDHRIISLCLKKLLDREGFPTRVTSNGWEALEAIELRIPCLVILDISMPRLDGLQVLKRMQAHPLWKQIPVIMFSAEDDAEQRPRCLALGAKAYLVKASTDSQTIIATVKKYMNPPFGYAGPGSSVMLNPLA